MKPRFVRYLPVRCRGFTWIELIVVMAVVAILVAMIIPRLANGDRRSQISCVNNLKQVGLGFKIFANDHHGQNPMRIWPSDPAIASAAYAPFNFQLMSNELSVPRILICPKDTRKPASSFASLTSSNVSYFVGLNARDDYPQMFLAGDRNLTTNGVLVVPGLLPITTDTELGWSDAMHKGSGNIALADGSVQQMMGSGFRNVVRQAPGGTNWLAIP